MRSIDWLSVFLAPIFASPAASGPPITPEPAANAPSVAGRYIGCATDPIEEGLGRGLNQAATYSASYMTLAKCRSFCDSKGFYYSGAEYGTECYCGNQLTNGAIVLADDSTCQTKCVGSRSACGGPNRMSLFASATVDPVKIDFDGGLYLGCASDPDDFLRSLDGPTYRDYNNMTVQSCRSFCDNHGYALSGVEYSSECYCGLTGLEHGGQYYDNDDPCYMACSGDAQQACGGPGTLSVFQTRLEREVSAAAGEALGCFSDPNMLGRALAGSMYTSDNMTNEACRAYCDREGYQYSGTEFSNQCFCGDHLINGGAQLAVNVSCNTPCSGNGFTDCGGPNLLSVFNKTADSTPSNVTLGSFTPTVVQTVNFTTTSYNYMGCYMEASAPYHAFSGFTYTDVMEMTVEACLGNCNALNYTYGGLEYSQQCYCGNDLNTMGAMPEAQCSYSCAGDSTEYCGGVSRLTVYSATTINVTSEASTNAPPSAKKFTIGTGGGAQRAVDLLKKGS